MYECFVCMSVCMYVYHMCTDACGVRSASDAPGIAVTGGCELPSGCWELNLGFFGRAASVL